MNEIWREWEGQVVDGKFPLQKYLGGSGHGIVFLTERTGPEPGKAAIKLVLDVPAEADTRLAVWTQTAALSHPNLLRIFESGRCRLGDTALLYVVMECAEEDLSQILPQRALSPAEAQDLLAPAVGALAYLHSKGFVHGHVKPSNIMAIADQVKLSSDCLCALRPSGGTWADYPGMDIYDPVYRPPEADHGSLTPAADIWSLGVTLVEVLTLRRRIWDRTGRGDNKEPELILPEGVQGPFRDIVDNCLIPEPHLRWTAAEIKTRLEGRIVPERVETARPKALPSPVMRKNTSAKWLYPAIALLGVTLVIVIAARVRHPALGQLPSGTTQTGVPQSTVAVPEESSGQPAAKPAPQAPATAPRIEPASDSSTAPGAVLQQVMPEVSQSARSTIEGHIRVHVRVAVDASGNVTGARLESAGPSKYFARKALESAQAWKFTPAKVGGQRVPSQWMLKYAFGSEGAKVYASQVSP